MSEHSMSSQTGRSLRSHKPACLKGPLRPRGLRHGLRHTRAGRKPLATSQHQHHTLRMVNGMSISVSIQLELWSQPFGFSSQTARIGRVACAAWATGHVLVHVARSVAISLQRWCPLAGHSELQRVPLSCMRLLTPDAKGPRASVIRQNGSAPESRVAATRRASMHSRSAERPSPLP